MFKRLKTNYNMSFLKELLYHEGKYAGEVGKEVWSEDIEGYKGYSFKGYSDKLRIKVRCKVTLTLQGGYKNEKNIWEFMNIEIKSIFKAHNDYYRLKVRLSNYETYADVNVENVPKGTAPYYYSGIISNAELNEIAKIIKDMHDGRDSKLFGGL